jgi:hypothetical protein
MACRISIAFVLVFATNTLLLARDLVVDNLRGSDSQNDRGYLSTAATFGPYRSINRALAGAQAGDRILLTNTGQPYRECISLVGELHSGSPESPFEIIGNGATLDGSVAPDFRRWKLLKNDVWALQSSPPAFAMMTSGGKLLKKAPLTTVDFAQLQPLEWARSGGTVYFKGEPNRGPMDYPLEVTDQTTGITLYDVRHVVIRDLTVRGYRVDGIQANDSAFDVTLVNIACRQNGRSGITVAGASSMTIGATLCEQNGDSQLRVEGQAVARLGKVDFDDSLAPKVVSIGAGRVEELPPQANP